MTKLDEDTPRVDARGMRPARAYGLHVEAPADGVLVLALEGEWDLAATGALRERVDAAVADGAGAVVLDLAATTFVDSSMLRELLRTDAALTAAGGRLTLAGVGPAVSRLLAVTGADELLRIAPSRERALEGVRA
jgi:anti-anti-sigma factor